MVSSKYNPFINFNIFNETDECGESKMSKIFYLLYSITGFLVFTIIYYSCETIINVSNSNMTSLIFSIYLILLIIFQGVINSLLANNICESNQLTKIIYITIVCWLFGFGIISVIIFLLTGGNTGKYLNINLFIGIIISIITYFYIVNTDCINSVEELQDQYTKYIDKITRENNIIAGGSQSREYSND